MNKIRYICLICYIEHNMQFKDIIGQENVKQHLRDMYAHHRIPHATMLLGGEGSGALALGVAFAQYINCTGDKSGGDSCGQCPSCQKYQKLVHPDLHSIFPVIKKDDSTTSDTYIAEWREMVSNTPYFNLTQWTNAMGGNKQATIMRSDAVAIHQKLSMKPYEAQYQVLLMWKPELMNEVAANRILKILEEPPSNTLFILVSESSAEILPTILSRTQMLKVPPIAEDDITAFIQQRYKMPETDARRIAHISNGNLINTLQIIGEAQEAKDNLDFFIKIMRCCYARKVPEMMQISEDTNKNLSREQIKNRLTYSLRMLRENFIMNLNQPELNYMTPEEETFSQKFSRFVHLNNVIPMSELINEAIAHVEQNGNVRIIIMDLLLRMTVHLKAERPE